MKKCVVNAGKIRFLNFTFNPNLRTLQQDDTVLQLRKKQSDVLALLCAKYPEPVSQAEFLDEVWGGYVTSQSIAQMICSLRGSLGDDTKSIIATIPKLGYQLTAQPYLEEPQTEPDKSSFECSFPGNIEVDNISFSTQPMINVIPLSANSMSVIPYTAHQSTPDRKKFSPQILLLSSIATIFFGLIFIAVVVRGNPLNFIKNYNDIGQMPLANLIPSVSNNFLYCCNTIDGAICHPKSNLLNAKCVTFRM